VGKFLKGAVDYDTALTERMVNISNSKPGFLVARCTVVSFSESVATLLFLET